MQLKMYWVSEKDLKQQILSTSHLICHLDLLLLCLMNDGKVLKEKIESLSKTIHAAAVLSICC